MWSPVIWVCYQTENHILQTLLQVLNIIAIHNIGFSDKPAIVVLQSLLIFLLLYILSRNNCCYPMNSIATKMCITELLKCKFSFLSSLRCAHTGLTIANCKDTSYVQTHVVYFKFRWMFFIGVSDACRYIFYCNDNVFPRLPITFQCILCL